MTITPCRQNYASTLTKSSTSDNESTKHQEAINGDVQSTKKCTSYDPYDYGNETHPTIFWGPVLHFFKAIVGTGILALPSTFESVGYAVAIPSTLLIAVLYIHVLRILLNVEYELCKVLKVPNLTYVGVVQHSLKKGPKPLQRFSLMAKFLVYFHYVVNGSLSNAVYLITIAENFKMMIDFNYKVDSNISLILSVVIIPLMILSLIKNLKFLVPLSTLTNAFNFINIFLILYLTPNRVYATDDDVRAVNDVLKFPAFFGIVIGALSCTGMVLPLKNDMENPRKFSSFFGVLHLALFAAASLYVVFGFFSYEKYGSRVQPNILTNLPTENNLTFLVLVLYSVALCVSYNLFLYIAFDTIWSNAYQSTFSRMKHRTYVEYAIRVGLCIAPYFVAIALPNFQIIVSISGVIGILVDVAVPPFIQMLLLLGQCGPKKGMTYVIILKDLFIVMLALILFGGGVVNVKDTISAFFA